MIKYKYKIPTYKKMKFLTTNLEYTSTVSESLFRAEILAL